MIVRFSVGLALLASASMAAAETYAVQAGRVIVDAAKPALGPSTVVVTDGRIAAIEPGAVAPSGATVVDMRADTVMPGLTDVHVHLTNDAGLPWYQRITPK